MDFVKTKPDPQLYYELGIESADFDVERKEFKGFPKPVVRLLVLRHGKINNYEFAVLDWGDGDIEHIDLDKAEEVTAYDVGRMVGHYLSEEGTQEAISELAKGIAHSLDNKSLICLIKDLTDHLPHDMIRQASEYSPQEVEK